MPVTTYDQEPAPRASSAITFPRLMQDTRTGGVYLVHCHNGTGFEGTLVHTQASDNGKSWASPVNDAVGEYRDNLNPAYLRSYNRFVSLQNSEA